LLIGRIMATSNELETARTKDRRNHTWIDARNTLPSPSCGSKTPSPGLPSNVRSLFAFGVFCFVGGAWLTLVTEVRTWPLPADTGAASVAPRSMNESREPLPSPLPKTIETRLMLEK